MGKGSARERGKRSFFSPAPLPLIIVPSEKLPCAVNQVKGGRLKMERYPPIVTIFHMKSHSPWISGGILSVCGSTAEITSDTDWSSGLELE